MLCCYTDPARWEEEVESDGEVAWQCDVYASATAISADTSWLLVMTGAEHFAPSRPRSFQRPGKEVQFCTQYQASLMDFSSQLRPWGQVKRYRGDSWYLNCRFEILCRYPGLANVLEEACFMPFTLLSFQDTQLR
jgi:hypothetical protein